MKVYDFIDFLLAFHTHSKWWRCFFFKFLMRIGKLRKKFTIGWKMLQLSVFYIKNDEQLIKDIAFNIYEEFSLKGGLR